MMMFLEQGATCGVVDGRYHSAPAWFWCCHGGGESASDGRAGERFLKKRHGFKGMRVLHVITTKNRCLFVNVNC